VQQQSVRPVMARVVLWLGAMVTALLRYMPFGWQAPATMLWDCSEPSVLVWPPRDRQS
jgi:hypothetical protein